MTVPRTLFRNSIQDKHMNNGTYRVENMLLEAEIIEGLEDHVINELQEYRGVEMRLVKKQLIQFTFSGNIKELLQLRTVNALYHVLPYDIPRPKALLGHQHFHRLLDAIVDVQSYNPPFQTIYIDAAGSNSSVMVRLKEELASALKLSPLDEKGDLLLRIRRSQNKRGWDVLIRLTERPLATREWRVCNFEGALNATVAAAMARWIGFQPDDQVLNLMCGSGSIMVEFLMQFSDAQILGVDNDPVAIACAMSNISAAELMERSQFIQADGRQTSLASQRFDIVLADLPFGQLVGTHEENRRLYPQIFQETARITRKNGHFLLLTHEVKLMEQVLDQFKNIWQKHEELRINLNGLHPRLYLLKKQ